MSEHKLGEAGLGGSLLCKESSYRRLAFGSEEEFKSIIERIGMCFQVGELIEKLAEEENICLY